MTRFIYSLGKKSTEKNKDDYLQQSNKKRKLNDDELKPEENDTTVLNENNINEYYLYNDITMKSIQGLLKFIKNAEKRWNVFLLGTYDLIEKVEPKPLKIFINSNGGDFFAAIPIIDTIRNSKIPIHTYVEGIAASASSLISIVGHKRFITKNSFMLIHELRGGVQGTYSNITDEKENCDKIMSLIKNIYIEKSNNKLKINILENILKRDIILSATECLKYGLVDEII